MQKRLKDSTRAEQRDFNSTRFEQDNPYYISVKLGGGAIASRFEDEDTSMKSNSDHFELNRDKILEVKASN
jgi:hypothetical protein